MNKFTLSTLAENVMESQLKEVDYLKMLADFVKAEFSAEVELVETGAEPISEYQQLKEALAKASADFVVLDSTLSDLLLASFPQIPSEVQASGFADSMLKQAGKLWPRNLISLALHELVIETSPKLDTHSIAYVTGSNALTQMCVALAIKLGFQKIVLVSEDFEAAKQRAEKISKLFFSVNITVLDDSELTLQPNNGTILFNCVSQETQPSLFNDLTYLNFISKSGLVIHLPFCMEENELLSEAKHVGIQTLSGVKVLAKRDFEVFKYYKIISLDFNSYFERWIYNLKMALKEQKI